ncbi:MAG: ribonuclease HII [Eubacteriales bacterium]|nr:ribonuclease HII [Eubacteriales bacterium]
MTKVEREEKLKKRLEELKAYEAGLHEAGKKYIAGVDEVGRGPLAGPVVAAACVLPEDFYLLGVDDSKKLSDKKRRELNEGIMEKALAYGFGIVGNDVIDDVNILEATKIAMTQAVKAADDMLKERTGESIDHVVIDALTVGAIDKPQTAIVHGDATCVSIAAASIIAKVKRDDMMIAYAEEYPGYGFEKNKGYGTREHYDGIRAQGITSIHRKSFLKNFTEKHSKV